MDSNNAIEVCNLVKSYSYETHLKGESSLCSLKKKKIEKKYVVDDITFNVRKGEVLGIIGRNGSGKSSLLSLIAKIMDPDSGSICCSGKVASVLELGMGFHPDMTGRENIYLKGELYGFSKKELDGRIEKIIEYSGLEDYIDCPVRSYSSGMGGRLAFSILVNVDADIMLVDEILSTGDVAFSSKASEHFKRLAKSGKTIIFVSHSINHITSLCSRVIWMEHGKIHMDGLPKKVCSSYVNSIEESPEVIQDLANSGVADSQYKLALMYRDGAVLKKDESKYCFWIEKAANSGHSTSQILYGDFLLANNRADEAKNYYELAAYAGNVDAYPRLASLCSSNYREGYASLINIFEQLAINGGPLDEMRYADLLLKISITNDGKKNAYSWFEKSSEHGNLDATFQLAMMCKDGVGTERNVPKAVDLLKKAAEGGLPRACQTLADYYEGGKFVEFDDENLFKYSLKSAEFGIAKYQFKVSMMYAKGIGTEVNLSESKRWMDSYSKSLVINHILWAAEAIKYVPINTSETIESLLLMAVETCSVGAYTQLGLYYKDGQFSFPQIHKSEEIFSHLSNIYGATKLQFADMHYRGCGVEQSIEKTISLYESCISFGDPVAAYRLGCIYRDGVGVSKDLSRAKRYFYIASLRGNRDAMCEYNKLNAL